MKVKVSLEELKAAIAELEARGKDEFINIEIEDNRNAIFSCSDPGDNIMEAILYHDRNMTAGFKYTSRLMFMKDKKRT